MHCSPTKLAQLPKLAPLTKSLPSLIAERKRQKLGLLRQISKLEKQITFLQFLIESKVVNDPSFKNEQQRKIEIKRQFYGNSELIALEGEKENISYSLDLLEIEIDELKMSFKMLIADVAG